MKAVSLLLLVCAVSVSAFAQKPKGTSQNSAAGLPLNERVFFGGGAGFGAGRNAYNGFKYTYISVSPLVGYRITMPWAAGAQVTYQTYRYPDQGVKLDQYGFAPFTQYRFGKLFGYAEYQMLSVPSFDNVSRRWYKRLPIGLGFSQPIGSKVALNAVALYDVTYNRATTPFGTPWIFRIYFTAGGISF